MSRILTCQGSHSGQDHSCTFCLACWLQQRPHSVACPQTCCRATLAASLPPGPMPPCHQAYHQPCHQPGTQFVLIGWTVTSRMMWPGTVTQQQVSGGYLSWWHPSVTCSRNGRKVTVALLLTCFGDQTVSEATFPVG